MRGSILALVVSAAAAHAAAQQPTAPAAPPTSKPPAAQVPAPQTPPTPAPVPGQPTPAPPAPGRVFTGDAGLIFFPVKPDKVADFETIMSKLHAALAMSDDPVKKAQAAGWKVLKAVEPGPNTTVLYVFLIDPAVTGAEYAFWKTIYEAFPEEYKDLYRLYTAASASGQTLLNLKLVEAFGEPYVAPPPVDPLAPPVKPITKPKPPGD